jgi:hypothetical protein
VAAVAARRPLFAEFVEALEAGEPDEESDRYFLLSGFAEMVLRADSAQDRAGIRQWADFCAFRSLDLACHLDSLGVTGDFPAGDADSLGASVSRAEGVELAAQAGIWRLAADDGPSDRAAEISAAARRLISAALANVADDG